MNRISPMTGGISVILLCLLHTAVAFAQYQTVQLSLPGTDPEEVTIAVNPVDPNNMIAAANIRYYYYSTNGGESWTQRQLPTGTYGDPAMCFAPDGTAFIGNLSYSYRAILVRRSTDGGVTWPETANLFGPSSGNAHSGSLYNSSLQDKEWLIADHSQSQHRGNVYCTWTDFTKYGSDDPSDSSVIVFARSLDTGKTFESYVRISDKAGDAVDSDNTVEGAVPAVGPDGEIYVVWAGPEGLYFDRSFDAGETWGTDKVISDMPGGWDQEISGIMRSNGLPVTLCDLSDSPYKGNIYVNWVDFRNGDPDVFVMKSTDKGETWSSPIRINTDETGNGKEQFFTWMAVDQVTGDLAAVFYDRRRYQTDSTDVYLARSTDGGDTWTNEVITEDAFFPSPLIFFGDYNNIAAHNGIIRPIWTEMHNFQLSIHAAIIGTLDGLPSTEIQPSKIEIAGIYPNPVSKEETGHIRASLILPAASDITLTIIDALGRERIVINKSLGNSGSHSIDINTSALETGVYFCCVRSIISGHTSSESFDTQRIVVLQ